MQVAHEKETEEIQDIPQTISNMQSNVSKVGNIFEICQKSKLFTNYFLTQCLKINTKSRHFWRENSNI